MTNYDYFILWTLGISLIAGGIVAASTIILQKIPKLEPTIIKVKPYSTAIGVLLFILGAVAGWFANDIGGTGKPIGANIAALLLGLIMMRPFLKLIKMDEKTRSRILNWLNGLQGTFGIIAIIMGVLRIIANITNLLIYIA